MKKQLLAASFLLFAGMAHAQFQESLEITTRLNKESAQLDTGSIHFKLPGFSDAFPTYGAPSAYLFKKKWLQRLFDTDLATLKGDDYKVTINPVGDFSGGKSTQNGTLYQNSRGYLIQGQLGKNIAFGTDFFENQGRMAGWVTDYYQSRAVIPAIGATKGFKNNSFDYGFANGYIGAKAGNHTTLYFGATKNFIGEGYRSMILSDNSASYPAFKAKFNFGNVEYMYLLGQMQDRMVAGNVKPFPTKYVAAHYVNWQFHKKWSIGMYDCVTWARDNANGTTRGIDMAYMNPFIFFRPVEYSTRSSDNAFLGLLLNYAPAKRVKIYGQFMLDEFRLSDYRNNVRSWAQKFGWQLGLKSFHTFGVKNLTFLAEWNGARPYTYSHQTARLSYSNANQALAHPLGANFSEAILMVHYSKGRWSGYVKAMLAQTGLDTNNVNFGSDIFKSYDTRFRNEQIIFLLGNLTNISVVEGNVSWLVNPVNNLRIEATVMHRSFNNITGTSNGEWVVLFGIRTRLYNRQWDF